MGFLDFLRGNTNWLAAGFLLAFSSSYGQTYFISIFAGEIMAEFGLTHGQWGGIFTIGTTMSAILMVWAGGLADALRIRVLAPVILLFLAASCVFMARVHVAWALVAAVFCLRFAGQGMAMHLSTVAMARWFSANRGRALAIAAMGFSVAQAGLPVIFVAAKGWMDWRLLWWVAAALALAAIVPISVLLRGERTPQSHSENIETRGMELRHWRRGEMLRHPLFWFIAPAIFGPGAWGTALFFQQVHLATIKDWTHAEFVSLIPLFTIVVIGSTFATGWAADRFGAGRLFAAQMLPLALGFGLLAGSDSLGMAAGCGRHGRACDPARSIRRRVLWHPPHWCYQGCLGGADGAGFGSRAGGDRVAD